jgi:NADP-dependent 3-hydroxy acid dehydrogenase YdfG
MTEALIGQTAVVTGASSGIGRAIALALAKQGADLCLVGRARDRLDDVADQVRKSGRTATPYATDLSRDAEIATLVDHLQQDVARVEILVHCAGAIALGKVAHAPAQDLDTQYRANVRAPYALTQALLPMLARERGYIVFINSSVVQSARPNSSQFAATQHALKAFADHLREEVNPEGIRVLSVFPGRTATPRQVSLYAREGRPYRPDLLLQPEDVAAVVVRALTLPRRAEVTSISLRPTLKSY